MERTSFLILSLLLTCQHVFSQQADTSFIIGAKAHALKMYEDALGTQRRLNNGSKFSEPEQTSEQHPYYQSDDWIQGNVFYDGEYFIDVPLMFDVYGNKVITEHQRSGHAIELVQEKLKHFSLDGRTFERIDNSTVNNSLPKTGFYEVLHPGESKLIALHMKFARDKIEYHSIERFYDEKTKFFVLKNNNYFPVASKSSVLRLFSDKKQLIRKFMKENKIVFSQDRATSLKKIAAFYDSLKKA